MIPNEEQLVEVWKRGVFDKADVLDPGYEHDWRSLALGFALGNGHSIELAEEFVRILTGKGLL